MSALPFLLLFCLTALGKVDLTTSPEPDSNLFPFFGNSWVVKISGTENDDIRDPDAYSFSVEIVQDQIHASLASLLEIFDKADVDGDKFLTEREVDAFERNSAYQGYRYVYAEPVQPYDEPQRDYDAPFRNKRQSSTDIPSAFAVNVWGEHGSEYRVWTALVHFANKHRDEIKAVPADGSGETAPYSLVRKVVYQTGFYFSEYGNSLFRKKVLHVRGGQMLLRNNYDYEYDDSYDKPRYFIVQPDHRWAVGAVNYGTAATPQADLGEPVAFTGVHGPNYWDVVLLQPSTTLYSPDGSRQFDLVHQCDGFNAAAGGLCYQPTRVVPEHVNSPGFVPGTVGQTLVEPDTPPGGIPPDHTQVAPPPPPPLSGSTTTVPPLPVGSTTAAVAQPGASTGRKREPEQAVTPAACTGTVEDRDMLLAGAALCLPEKGALGCMFTTSNWPPDVSCVCGNGRKTTGECDGDSTAPTPRKYDGPVYDGRPIPDDGPIVFDDGCWGPDCGYSNSNLPDRGVLALVGIVVLGVIVGVVLLVYCRTSGAPQTQAVEVHTEAGGVVPSSPPTTQAMSAGVVVSSAPAAAAAPAADAPLAALCGACGAVIRYVRPSGHQGAVDVPCPSCQAVNRLAAQ